MFRIPCLLHKYMQGTSCCYWGWGTPGRGAVSGLGQHRSSTRIWGAGAITFTNEAIGTRTWPGPIQRPEKAAVAWLSREVDHPRHEKQVQAVQRKAGPHEAVIHSQIQEAVVRYRGFRTARWRFPE